MTALQIRSFRFRPLLGLLLAPLGLVSINASAQSLGVCSSFYSSGFTLTQADLTDLAKTLKTLCGSGGTARNEAAAQTIELQGDHREKVAEKLKESGYKVKFAGG